MFTVQFRPVADALNRTPEQRLALLVRHAERLFALRPDFVPQATRQVAGDVDDPGDILIDEWDDEIPKEGTETESRIAHARAGVAK